MKLDSALETRRWERCLHGHVPGLVARAGNRLVDWLSELRPDLTVRQQRSNKWKGKEKERKGSHFKSSKEILNVPLQSTDTEDGALSPVHLDYEGASL
jgi:hypothetical protein